VRTSVLLVVSLLSLPAAAAPLRRRHDGFVGQLQLGLGECTDDACDESNAIGARYETGFAFGAFLGYRFPWPYVSVGGNLGFAFHPVDDEIDTVEDASAHSWAFDFDGRFHPLVQGVVDPWVGLGFGYAFAGSSWSVTRTGADESTTTSGPAFVFSLGADFWVADEFALGLAFRYMVVFWNDLCIDTDLTNGRFPGSECVSPDTWTDRRVRNADGTNFDSDQLPDLVQFLVTGTFAP
jgi:outer membrane protein with beta-barrel domain